MHMYIYIWVFLPAVAAAEVAHVNCARSLVANLRPAAGNEPEMNEMNQEELAFESSNIGISTIKTWNFSRVSEIPTQEIWQSDHQEWRCSLSEVNFYVLSLAFPTNGASTWGWGSKPILSYSNIYDGDDLCTRLPAMFQARLSRKG